MNDQQFINLWTCDKSLFPISVIDYVPNVASTKRGEQEKERVKVERRKVPDRILSYVTNKHSFLPRFRQK